VAGGIGKSPSSTGSLKQSSKRKGVRFSIHSANRPGGSKSLRGGRKVCASEGSNGAELPKG